MSHKRKSTVSIIPPSVKEKEKQEENTPRIRQYFKKTLKIIGIISTIGGVIALTDWVIDFYKRPQKEWEAKYEKNSGILTPKSTTEKSLVWPLGTGYVYFPNGIFDLQGVIPELPDIKTLKKATVSPFSGINFKAWLDKGKIKVTTKILDMNGNIIADMVENEWNVNKPAYAYDRNFNDTSLEVKDHSGNVVFQIDVSDNRVYLRGVFHRPDSLCVAVLTNNPTSNKDTSALGFIATFNKKDYKEIYSEESSPMKINPIFKYPSDLHKGQRSD